MQIGERIYNLERMFNLKAGIGGDQDTLPKRILNEGIPSGPAQGQVSELGKMLPEYYEARGWSSDGEPSADKLQELRLI
jgi:aldehyde:ferredoxin oxidoreductase